MTAAAGGFFRPYGPAARIGALLTAFVIAFSNLTLLNPPAAQAATWVVQTTPTTNHLEDVHFPIDAVTGWAVGGGGVVLKTVDGGAVWSLSTPTTQSLFGVRFIDTSTGWVVGANGTILKTVNGGGAWTPQTAPVVTTYNGISFLDATTGYAVGGGGTILKTVDGGTNWVQQTTPTAVTLNRVVFPVDGSVGYAVGQSGVVLKTVDGGTNWVLQTTPTANTLAGVSFVDNDNGWVSGNGPTILHTSNGGGTWAFQTSPTAEQLDGIHMFDALNGFILGNNGTILQTANGGAVWTQEPSPTANHMNELFWATPTTGFAAGNGGTILMATATPSISGRVFHDIAGNLLDGSEEIGDGDNPGIDAVEVWIYDDATGTDTDVPDASDNLIAGPVPTVSGGYFSFPNLATTGTYWVVVDSQDVGPDTRWAEQTYGPIGGWCADGTGGTGENGSAGGCFGGRRADQSDDLSAWYDDAEHIARVAVAGANVDDVDFGFSFNVVTNTRGGNATPDPGATGTQKVQGSLRQFILNANDVAGANSMRFVPAEATNQSDGFTNDWWRIAVTDALPSISDPDTTLDAAAYSLSNGITPINPNDADIGSGASVGVAGGFSTPVLDPDLELVGLRTINAGIDVQTTGVTVSRFSIWGFGIGINARPNADDLTVTNNVIGSGPAALSDPGAGARTEREGVAIVDGSDDATVTDNIIAYNGTSGLLLDINSTNLTARRNEIVNNAVEDGFSDGVGLYGTTSGATIEGNLISNNGGHGVDVIAVSGAHTITENTITGNGTGGVQTAGVRLDTDGHTVSLNIIGGQVGAGVIVRDTNTGQVHVTQNHFTPDNGSIAIDLVESGGDNNVGDGINLNDGALDTADGNDGLDYPIIETAVIVDTELTVTGMSRPGVDIEFYEAVGAVNDQNTGSVAHGEGIRYMFLETEGGVGDGDANPDSYTSPDYGTDAAAQRFSFTVTTPTGLNVGDSISAIAIDVANTSEFGPNVVVTGNMAPSFDQDLGDRTDGTGAAISIDSGATDPDTGDTLLYSATGLPPGITINTSTGLISGTIDAGAEGGYAVTITVTDDGTPVLNDVDTFTWTVATGIALVSDITPGTNDRLSWMIATDFNPATNETDIGAGTGTTTIEGMDVQPQTGIAFAAAGADMGTIDAVTGVWTSLGTMGSADGAVGTITIDDVTAIAFDPLDGSMYAVHRRTSDFEDLLVQIDPASGVVVADAFGAGVDYLVIEANGARNDVSGAAVDPTTGIFYVVAGDDGTYQNQRLLTVDTTTGSTSNVGDTNPVQVRGLAFDTIGQLWGVGVEDGVETIENLYEGNKATAAFTNPRQIDNGDTYYAVASPLNLAPGVFGHVFEDAAGDLLPGGQVIGDSDNPTVNGVDVWLYNDDGTTPDQPDVDDTLFAGPIATTGDGQFSFPGTGAGTFWAVVDSQDLGPDTRWAEQTYGPEGAWCANGSGGTVESGDPGACYGGRRGSQSDDLTPWYTDAEHIARVVVGGVAERDVNFGFSFNVVTNARGETTAADPGATGTQTIQGSLRQFISNANDIAGANAMRFVPAVPPNVDIDTFPATGDEWWRIGTIAVGNELPDITGADTTIDGTAYLLSDGVTPRETLFGSLGGGTAVGALGTVTLAGVPRPELELLHGAGTVAIEMRADSTTVRAITINGGSIGIQSDNTSTDNVVEDLIIGADPLTGADPGLGNRVIRPFLATGSSTNGTIQRTYMAHSHQHGVLFQTGATGWTFDRNEVRNLAVAFSGGDAVATTGGGSATMSNNLIDTSGGFGISLNSSGSVVTDNTITGAGSLGLELAGIGVPNGTATITRNLITGNPGPGITIGRGNGGVAITENEFGSNGGIAIDWLDELDGGLGYRTGDGISLNDGLLVALDGNDGLDFPVIESASIVGSDLVLRGFARPGVTIEFYEAVGAVNDENTANTAHGEGIDIFLTETEGGVNDLDLDPGSYTDPAYGTDAAAERFEFVIPVPGDVVVGDEISAIAIDGSNNTSEFGPNATVGMAVAGTVFEDITANLLDGGESIGVDPNPGADAVTVYLYLDDGDLAPDSGDTAMGSTATIAGDYWFGSLTPGRYWVVVDSLTIGSSQDPTAALTDIWAEQTYGPAGAWCANGSGGTSVLGANGACFGGRRVDPVPANPSSDEIGNWYDDREHLALVDVTAASVDNAHFGFSFNVVTTTRGGDGTDEGPNNRTVQGSLRQFVQNANAITTNGPFDGANVMRFVPAEAPNASGSGQQWWTSYLSNQLPTIVDGLTTIDGTAYQFANGVLPRETNVGTFGSAGTFGIDGLPAAAVPAPELELANKAIRVDAPNVTIRAIAMYRDNNIQIDSLGDDFIGEDLLLGARADNTDPGANRSNIGILASGATAGTVRNSIFAWHRDHGITLAGSSDGWLIEQVELISPATNQDESEAIEITGSGSATIRGSLIQGSRGSGIDMLGSTGGNTVENNTITGNGVAGKETFGVRVGGSGNTFSRNIIFDNVGAGIGVTGSSTGNVITRNSMYGNGSIADENTVVWDQIGIDLLAGGDDEKLGKSPYRTLNDDGDGDGDGNELQNFPVIETAQLTFTHLVFEGFVASGSTIEFYLADPEDPGSPAEGYGEGQTWLYTGIEGQPADLHSGTGSYSGLVNDVDQGAETNVPKFRFQIPLASLPALSPGDPIVATATVGGQTSEFSGIVPVTDLVGLDINKASDAGGAILPGENITYTIDVSALSVLEQTNVTVGDTLPDGTSWVSTTINGFDTYTVADQFNVISYSNNDGSVAWAGPWIETGDDGTPSGGEIFIEDTDEAGPDTALRVSGPTNEIERAVDLSGISTAILSFDYWVFHLHHALEEVYVDIWDGSSWTRLETFTLIGPDSEYTEWVRDITPWADANTKIRFSTPATTTNSEGLWVNDLRIIYSVPAAPVAGDEGPVLTTGQTLLPGDTLSVTYVVTVDDPPTEGSISNTATANSTEQPFTVEDTVVDTVTNRDPVVDALSGGPVDEGSLFNLSGTFSDADSPFDTHDARVDWGDGAGFGGWFAVTAPNVASSNTYADNGLYTVVVEVRDSRGGVGSNNFDLTVSNVAPSVTLSGAADVDEGSSYSLTVSGVTDPGADTVTSWVVDWGDGDTDTFGTAPGTISHTYADGDTSPSITIDLVDEDGTHTDVDTLPITVNNVAPTVAADNATVTVDEGSGAANTGTFGDVGDDTVTISVDVGSVTQDDLAGTWSWSYTPVDGPDDTQTVTVTATDSDGADTTTTFNLTVNNVDPVVTLSGAPEVDEGSSYSLTVSAVTDPGTDTVSDWVVRWGDGDTDTYTSAPGTITHTYADGDTTPTITIDLVDEDGTYTTVDSLAITVNNVAPTVAADNATVTVDEASAAGNTGTFGDVGDDTVTISVDVGSVTQDDLAGTWSWSYTPDDGPDETQTVTVTATDSDGADTTTTFNLVVDNVAPTVAADNATVTVDEASAAGNTGTFGDVGDDTVTISVDVGSVTQDDLAGTWSWSYTPDDGPDETQTVTITATDSDLAVTTTTFNLVVDNVAPTVAADNATVTVDEASAAGNTGTFGDVGDDTVTISVDVGSVTQDDLAGTWSWSYTPDDGPDETQTVTITATDSDLAVTTTTFNLVVDNVAPTVAADNATVTVDEASAAGNTGTFGDVGDDTVTITVDVGSVTQDDIAGTWSWSYTPDDGPDETQTVTVTATDSDGADTTTTFNLVVDNVAPTVAADNATVTVDEASAAGNTGTFGDVGDDTVTITVDVGSVTQDDLAGTWSWSYTPDDGPDETQTVTVTATDSDGADTTTTFNLVVDNVAPTVAADNATVTVDEASAAANTGTFGDVGDDTVTISVDVGSVTQDDLAGTWSWSYTPDDGPDETQTVTITATDSDLAVTTTTFNLVVDNVAPTVAADNATVTVDEASAAGNTGTFGDVGDDTVTISVDVGSVTQDDLAGTWSWSYTPDDGPDETQTVTVTATDSDGADTTTTFNLVVDNVAPTVAADNATVTVDEASAAGNTGTFGDVGDDTVTISVDVGSVTQDDLAGTWSWSYTPDDGPDETQTVTITATDSDGADTTTTFNLVVDNVAPTVAADNATVTVDEASAAGNTGTFGDVGDDTVTISVDVGSVTQDDLAGTWSWSYTPDDGPDETQTVTVTATDSDGADTTTTFNLVVDNVAPTVAADNATVTVDEASAAANTGTFGDVGDDTVTITVDVGSVTQDDLAGTWSWSYTPDDGPDETQTITITATDSDGADTTTTFNLVVDNVAPTVAADNATVTVDEASAAANTGTFGDVGDDTVTITVDVGSVTQDDIAGTWSWSYTPDDGPDETQTITITATDSDLAVTTTTFNLVVDNVAPTVTADNATVTVDEASAAANTGTFGDVGDDTVTITVDVGSVTQDDLAGTWSWSYTPDDGPDETQTITITATDSDLAVTTTTFNLVVDNVAPTVAADNATVTVDEASPAGNTGTFGDVGDDTVTITVDVGSVTQDDLAGTWSWSYTPDDGPDETQTITITATDSDLAVTTTTFNLVVDNVAPTVTADNATVTVDEASAAANTGTFGDVGDDTVTITVDVGSVTQDDLAGTWSWSYTPDDGPDETQTITITATDSDLAVTTTTFNLVVDNVAPTVAADNATVTVDEASPAGNTGTFGDVGDDTVTITVDVGSVTQDDLAGTWSWSYTPDDGPDETQTITVTATDSDGADTTTTFNLVVDNVAPTVAADNATVTVDEASAAANTGTFGDVGDDTVTITVDVGSVTQDDLAGTWSWFYTPDDGPDETQTITITATDSDGADTTTTFNLVVDNVAPTVAAGTDQTGIGIGETVSLDPATFTDPAVANDTHTATIDWGDGSPVEPGTVDDALDTVSGSHSYGAPGVYTVRVTVIDDDGGSGFDELTVTVANTTPVIDPVPDQAGDEGTLFTFTAGATDPDSPETLTFTIEDGVDPVPAGVSMTAGGVFTWTPTEAQGWNDDDGIATYELVVRVTDALGATDSTPVTITVDEVNEPPVVTNPGDQTTDEGVPVSLFVTGSDPDLPANVLSWTATGLPPGLSINPLTGEIHGAIAFTAGPSYVVTVRLTDGDGAFDEESFTWDVTDAGAGLTITKTPDVGDGTPVTPGDSIDYTITVTNNDSVTHTGVEIRELLPDGTTWSSTTIALPEVDTVADDFDTVAYTNNTGTDLWTGPWTETGDDGTASGGTIRIHDDRPSGFELALDLSGPSRSIEREVDLFGASAVELTFSFNPYHIEHAGEEIYLEVWDGSLWTLLHTFTLVPKSDESYFAWTEDLTDYAATDTKIRFRTSPGLTVSEGMFVNDLQIRYSHPATPIAGGAGPVLTTGQSLAPGEFIVIHYVVDTDDPPTELTIDNQAETDSDQQTTIVATTSNPTDNRDPVIAPLSGGPVAEASLFTLAASFSDPDSPFDTHEARVDWGDGAGFGTWFAVTEPNITDTTTYPDNGTYTITVEVRDSRGGTDTETFDLSVTNVDPALTLSGAPEVDEGTAYSLTVSAVTDPGADTVTSWAVHWGDGDTDTFGSDPGTITHTYADGDTTPTITIDLVDEDGTYTAVDSLAITVNNVAPTVAADNATVTVDEASLAANTGSFGDVGDDTVTISVSVGSVTQDDLAGTWSWTYTPDDGPDETQTVTVTATDSDGADTTTTFDLTVVNVAPTVTADNATVTVDEASGAANTGTFGDVGDDTVTISVSVGSVTQDDLAGTWSWTYTPDDGPDETQTVTITATDSDGADTTTTFDLTVVNVAPTVTADNATVTVDEASGAANTGTFGDVGDDTVTISVSVGSVTQDDLAGTWSWTYTPDDGPDETQTVTVTATDSDGADTTTTFDLTVVNVAPTVTADNATVTVDEASGAANTGTFGDVGDDTVTISVSVGSVTQDDLAGTWSWTYTPDDGPDETQTVTITATDSDGADTDTTFNLVVNNVPPTVTADNATVTVDEASLAANTGTFGDVGDDTVTISVSVGSVTQDDLAGTWSWTYTPDDGPDETQTVTVTATDSDGADTTTTFDLTVVNVAPTVTADNATVTVDEASGAANTGTFGDVGDDTVTISVSVGSVTQDDLAGTWSWTYTPDDGPDETQTVTITATDSDGADTTTTFDLTVVNVAPTVTADNATVTVDEASGAANTGTFGDVGDDTVTISVSVGSVTQDDLAGTWSWTYTPDDGPDETQTVTVTATDSDGADTTTTFDLTVVNVAPTVTADNATVTVDEASGAANTGTFGDVGDDTVTISVSVGSVTQDDLAGTWSWTYTPDDGPDETQTVTITATDSDGADTDTTFNLVVNNVPPTVTADNATVTVDEASLAANTGTFGDVGDDTVTISVSVGSVTQDDLAGTWSWTYTPDDGPDETQTVTVTATDSDGADTTTTFDLTVVNVAPTVTADNATVTVDEASGAANTGTFGDVGDDTVTITVSVGSVTQDDLAGTWSWTYTPDDGPDETQTVTVTATDSDGADTTTTFDLTVVNVAPTVTADNATVTVDEASGAANTGTFGDVGDDTVTISVSVGSVTQDDLAGTWSWTYTPDDGPDETQTVTVTATDSDGADTDTTFNLVVNNVPPTVTADTPTITVDEASGAANTGTFGDVGDDTVTISVSVGSVTQDDLAGTWSWTYTPDDGPDETQTVTVTATDSDGADTDTTFDLTVNNVTPVVTLSGDPNVDEGSPYSLTVSGVTDPGADTVSSWVVHWGDTSSDTYATAPGTVTHTYADGDTTPTITIDLVDEDGTYTTVDSLGISVDNVAPSVSLSGAGNVDEGTAYSLTVSSVTDPGADTVSSWVVHWGDTSSDTYATAPGTVTHTYADGDTTPTITIDLVDEDGTYTTVDSLPITVDNVAPSVSLSGAANVDEGSTYSLTVSAATDPGSDTVSSWVVHWGDGDTDTYAAAPGTISHTYADGDTTPTITIDLVDEDGTYTTVDSMGITVDNVAPTVTVTGSGSGDEGAPYSLTIGTVVDPGDDTVSSWVVDWGDGNTDTYAMPPGTITHTYTGDGSYTITVAITDEDGTYADVGSPASVVVANTAPVLDPVSDVTVDELTSTSFTATAFDAGGDPLLFTLDGEPAGAAMTGGGVFTWTPTEVQGPGVFSFDVVVTDDGGLEDRQTVTVSVDEVNVAPSVTSPGDQTTDEDVGVSLPIFATDPDLPVNTLLYAAVGLPDGLSIDSGTGLIAGTVTFDAAGVHPVTVTVTDDGSPNLFDQVTFTWTIDNINRPPTADDITIAAAAGVPETITLVGADPDGDALTYVIGSTPTLGVLVPGTLPTVTYLPNVDADGTDTFTYTVTDGDLVSAPAVVTFGIGANGAPIAAPDTFEIEQNDTLTVPAPGVLGNDLDPDGAGLTAVLVTPPTYGTLTLNDDGSFTYSHDGPHGVEDTFTYTAFDGIRTSEPIDVTIDVAPNLNPVASDDEIEINEDTIASLLPLTNDFDPDGDPITITAIAEVANGVTSIGPNGFVYTPEPNWHGVEVLNYTIQDDRGGTATASITIRVTAINDAPIAPSIGLTAGGGDPATILNPLSVAFDPDGDPLDYTLGSPEHGRLVPATTGWTYIPDAGFNGDDAISYTVYDGNGGSATGFITISVSTPTLSELGGNLVEFGPPEQAGESAGAAVGLGLPGMRLLVGSVFETFEAFRIPLLILAIVFGLSLLLSITRGFILNPGPIFLAAIAPFRTAVVIAPAGERVPVREEPGDKNEVIHFLEPAERNLYATGRRAQVDGELWVEIETDDGDGWVAGAFLTRQVSDLRFAGADEPDAMLKVLHTVLETSGNLALVAGASGLAVAHFAPPETFPNKDLPDLLASEEVWAWWGRSGSIQDEDGTFAEIVATPLLESMRRYEARHEPEASAPIPIELVNYQSVVYADPTIPGKDAWRVFFDLDHENNWTIAAIWREAVPNPNAAVGGRRLIST